MKQPASAFLVVACCLVLVAPALWAGNIPPDEAFLRKLFRVNPDGTALELLLPSEIAVALGSVALDPVNEKIYWNSYQHVPGHEFPRVTLRRADLDGDALEEILLFGSFNLGIDPAGGKIYYVEAEHADCSFCGSINKANLDGDGDQILVYRTGWTPLAIDLDGGKLYWEHWDGRLLMSANLDGSGQQVLISETGNMVDIEIDPLGQELYWINLDGEVRRAGLDGTEMETLVTGLDSPRGLALDPLGDRMWWTDVDAGTIQRARLDGSDVTTIVSGLDEPAGLAFLPSTGEGDGSLYFLSDPVLINVVPDVPATSPRGIVALLLLLGLASSLFACRRMGASARGRTGNA